MASNSERHRAADPATTIVIANARQREADGTTAVSGEAFRLLVEAVQDYAIFLLSPTGTVLSWNLGAERIKGYAAGEIIGRHFSAFYTPEDREANRPVHILGVATEQGRVEDEGWRVRKDGTRFWADVVVTALRGDDGTLVGFAKVTRDLTERRAAEEQRQALVAEQRARAAAEEALLARDRFLSIASHELKTPIASLQLATESIVRARDAGRLDDERLTTGLERMVNATVRLGALVNELLDVSRLTADIAPWHREPLDLAAIINDVVARFREIDRGDRIRFTDSASTRIAGDSIRLEQVFTNLVDNALKYSTPPAPVDVALVERDGGVQITVSDAGIGLDEEEGASHIFDAFGRAPNAQDIQGLGLGLYISRQIIERHGGRITARARDDGPGAVFSVWLPASEPTRP